jgi:hypothetical protein
MVMIQFTGPGVRLCDGVNRREILRVGGLGMLGGTLNLTDLLSQQSSAKPDPGRAGSAFGQAKSCIVLFLMGGPSQHSTWDPKPDAPAEVRGDFRPIATAVPGVSICELFSRTAKVTDKVCFLRAVSTGDNAHSSSGYYMLTGTPHQPKNFENANPGAPNDAPSLGAVMNRVAPDSRRLPAAITLPHRIFNTDGSVWPGQDAGFLGRGTDPWLLNAKTTPEGYQIEEIRLPTDLDPTRIENRRLLLDRLRGEVDGLDRDGTAKLLDRRGRQAFDLLLSSRARRAFQIEEEPESIRYWYGHTPFGRGVLLARRLVEAGVRLVQVNWYRGADEPADAPCWDSHVRESARLKDVLVPPTDRAFSALVEDLAGRGRLDETLVVCMSEFGRTPKIENGGGRGHWGSVFSVALAGGGICGGQVFGASDRIGAYPKEGLVRPEDLSATIFHCLGYRPQSEYSDPLGRPHPISRGEVIHGIL